MRFRIWSDSADSLELVGVIWLSKFSGAMSKSVNACRSMFRSTGSGGLLYLIPSFLDSSWQKNFAWLRLTLMESSCCQLLTCWRAMRYSTNPWSAWTFLLVIRNNLAHSRGLLSTYWERASRKISSLSKPVSTPNRSLTYMIAGRERAPFITRELAMDPLESVAISFV